MVTGMFVLGGVGQMAFAATDSSLSDQSGAVQVALMGLYMTIPMVAWMAYRGHTTAQNAEMAGSMIGCRPFSRRCWPSLARWSRRRHSPSSTAS